MPGKEGLKSSDIQTLHCGWKAPPEKKVVPASPSTPTLRMIIAITSSTSEKPAWFRSCAAIVDAYQRGTDHHIGADDDGLLTAGDANTQLTWMDAARGGVVFTPRHGKAVEINALWHHAQLCLADMLPHAHD